MFFVLVARISAQSENDNDVKELNATITCEINGIHFNMAYNAIKITKFF